MEWRGGSEEIVQRSMERLYTMFLKFFLFSFFLLVNTAGPSQVGGAYPGQVCVMEFTHANKWECMLSVRVCGRASPATTVKL